MQSDTPGSTRPSSGGKRLSPVQLPLDPGEQLGACESHPECRLIVIFPTLDPVLCTVLCCTVSTVLHCIALHKASIRWVPPGVTPHADLIIQLRE